MVEVRDVVRGVDNVETGQDHHHHRHQQVQQVQQEVQQETGEGGRYPAGCYETNTRPHYIEAPGPVSLAIGYFVTVQSCRNVLPITSPTTY